METNGVMLIKLQEDLYFLHIGFQSREQLIQGDNMLVLQWKREYESANHVNNYLETDVTKKLLE